MEIYLDNSATTPLCKEARDAMLSAAEVSYGNPSAVHGKGIEAKTLLETARRQVASVVGASPREIRFSHSGTLANNTAIFGAAAANRRSGNRIVTTAVEHPSVARCMDALEQQGFEVIRLKPSDDGHFSVEDLFSAVNKNTILISAMLVNNETGAVNPVRQIADAVRQAGAPALIHVDAIQGFGKLPLKTDALKADLMTFSGHKVHAPKGVGALYIRKGVKIKNYIYGGGQEDNLFSGTEPVPAIAGFGAAAAALGNIDRSLERAERLRETMIENLSDVPGFRLNSPADALPYVINLSVTGIPSQVMINALSQKGIYVSAGSACKKGRRSEVLTAMGVPPAVIDSAIRVSLSRFTTEEDVLGFCAGVQEAAGKLRRKR
ncbi:MAG: cysteine desulfurase [Clostridia bacterium]|nr:cysteine desulfurase [Clostridia bacterium]